MSKNNFLEGANILAGMAFEATKKKMGEAGKFFEEQIGKAGNFFDEKKEIVEIMLEIADKKAELEQQFAEYGKLCYVAAEDEDMGVVEATEAIEKAESEIAELEKRLEELLSEESEEETFYCTKCGTEHSGDDGFCKKCGKELKK